MATIVERPKSFRETCQALLGKYVQFVDDKLAIDSSEWTLTAAAEDQINQIFDQSDISDTEKLNQTIAVMLTDRTKQTDSPRRQRWTARAIEAALNPESDWYNRSVGRWIRAVGSPHFN